MLYLLFRQLLHKQVRKMVVILQHVYMAHMIALKYGRYVDLEITILERNGLDAFSLKYITQLALCW